MAIFIGLEYIALLIRLVFSFRVGPWLLTILFSQAVAAYGIQSNFQTPMSLLSDMAGWVYTSSGLPSLMHSFFGTILTWDTQLSLPSLLESINISLKSIPSSKQEWTLWTWSVDRTESCDKAATSYAQPHNPTPECGPWLGSHLTVAITDNYFTSRTMINYFQ